MKAVLKNLLTLSLSAMLALPAPSYARDQVAEAKAAEDTTQVFMGTALNPDGSPVSVFGAKIPAAYEDEFVQDVARVYGSSLNIQISGPEDKALRAVKKAGFLGKVKAFLMPPKADKRVPALSEDAFVMSYETGEKVRKKINQISEFARSNEASGIFWSVVNSGAQAGIVTYSSSSVEAGLAVFSMYTACNLFIMLKNEVWGRWIDNGGKYSVKIGRGINALFGKEMTAREERLYDVAGAFAVTWAISSAQGAFVKSASGEFADLSGFGGFYQAFVSSGGSGVANNTGIWDPVIIRAHADGKLTDQQKAGYYKLQMGALPFAEGAGMQGVPYVGLALSTVTTAGVLYLILNPEKQEAVLKGARKMKSGIAYLYNPAVQETQKFKRKLASGLRRVKDSCAEMLSTKKFEAHPGVFNRVSYGDVN